MTTNALPTGPFEPSEVVPRLEPQPVEDLRDDWLATLSRVPGDGLKGAGFPRNVLGVLMHSPDTFGPLLEYWVTGKEKMGLSVREQELVILRMGCQYRSNYVWKHHVLVAREFGVDDTELDGVRRGVYDSFIPRERALLALTDEMVDQRTVTPASWAHHRPALRDGDLVDLIELVAQYVMFALANNVMQCQIEAPLAEVPAIDGLLGTG